jgi:hypothetical protein
LRLRKVGFLGFSGQAAKELRHTFPRGRQIK